MLALQQQPKHPNTRAYPARVFGILLCWSFVFPFALLALALDLPSPAFPPVPAGTIALSHAMTPFAIQARFAKELATFERASELNGVALPKLATLWHLATVRDVWVAQDTAGTPTFLWKSSSDDATRTSAALLASFLSPETETLQLPDKTFATAMYASSTTSTIDAIFLKSGKTEAWLRFEKPWWILTNATTTPLVSEQFIAKEGTPDTESYVIAPKTVCHAPSRTFNPFGPTPLFLPAGRCEEATAVPSSDQVDVRPRTLSE